MMQAEDTALDKREFNRGKRVNNEGVQWVLVVAHVTQQYSAHSGDEGSRGPG
jgi:hypothetical protein